MHVFWPKTEKEHQLNITTLIHYSTVFNFYDKYTPQTLARWGKTPSRHPQTPPRHPTYTPKFSTFWLRLVTGRKGNSLIWQLLFNCLWFIWHLYSPRHLLDTPRYDPDTVGDPQTPSRHSPDRHRRFYVLEGTGKKGNIWVDMTFIQFYQQIWY